MLNYTNKRRTLKKVASSQPRKKKLGREITHWEKNSIIWWIEVHLGLLGQVHHIHRRRICNSKGCQAQHSLSTFSLYKYKSYRYVYENMCDIYERLCVSFNSQRKESLQRKRRGNIPQEPKDAKVNNSKGILVNYHIYFILFFFCFGQKYPQLCRNWRPRALLEFAVRISPHRFTAVRTRRCWTFVLTRVILVSQILFFPLNFIFLFFILSRYTSSIP